MTKAPETIWAAEMAVRLSEMQAERDEARRRRDEWRKKAEGFDALQSAVRSGIDEAGDRNLSRVFLRGALEVSEKERDAAIARAEKAEATRKWQPIEAAPKDGTEFLGFVGVSYQGGVVVLHWDKIDGLFIDREADFWDPTHWMPLPPPPETP